MILFVCSSSFQSFHWLAFFGLYSSQQKSNYAPTTHNLEESKRRSSRALHGEFDFNFLFWVTVCIIHTYLFKKSLRLTLTPIHPPLGVFHVYRIYIFIVWLSSPLCWWIDKKGEKNLESFYMHIYIFVYAYMFVFTLCILLNIYLFIAMHELRGSFYEA